MGFLYPISAGRVISAEANRAYDAFVANEHAGRRLQLPTDGSRLRARHGLAVPVATQTQAAQRPPIGLDAPAHYVTFYRSPDHRLVSGVTWETSAQIVRIRTTWLRPGADVKSLSEQPVRYWPTCAAKIADRTLCVAGRSPSSGNTIVELWTMTAPSIAADGTVVAATSESVTALYDAQAAGREDVRGALPMWGADGSAVAVLLWFEPSREVWKLTIGSREMTRIATPSAAGAPAFVAPELANSKRAWAGIESGGGYVYVFDRRANDLPLDATQASLVVLRDAGRDGALDAATLETPAALIAAGWNQGTHWTAW